MHKNVSIGLQHRSVAVRAGRLATFLTWLAMASTTACGSDASGSGDSGTGGASSKGHTPAGGPDGNAGNQPQDGSAGGGGDGSGGTGVAESGTSSEREGGSAAGGSSGTGAPDASTDGGSNTGGTSNGGATGGGGVGGIDGGGATGTGATTGTGGATVRGGAIFDRGKDVVLVTQVVGTAGGTLTGPASSPIAGVSVTFPPGALGTDTAMSLGYNDGVVRNTVGDWSRVVILLKSAGATEFGQPVSLQIPVTDATALVTPYFIDDADDIHVMPAAEIDATAGIATFETFHASDYTSTTLPPSKCDRLLGGSSTTTFIPSRDGFSFGNTRTYIPANSPDKDGVCLGMTEFALWWFEHRGNPPKGLWSSGSVDCQKTLGSKAHNLVSSRLEQLKDEAANKLSFDSTQMCEIAAALADTGNPVILSLGGDHPHSVLATGYGPSGAAASKCGGDVAIHVYDPNIGTDDKSDPQHPIFKPADDTIICYDTHTQQWQRYQSSYVYDNIWLHGDGAVKADFTGWSCDPEGGWGDPHLYTFDGVHYDFQRVGEFVLAETDDGLSVQARLAPYNKSRKIATVVAVAAKIGDNRVEINALGKSGTELWVNDSSSAALDLSGGGSASLLGFAWPDGTKLDVVDRGGRLDVQLHGVSQPAVRGLLGNENGKADDEFALRDGTTLKRPLGDADWASFTKDWRISNAESLFHYEAGQDTSTFTDASFPDAVASVAALSSSEYSTAKGICLAAGVSDLSVSLLESCILDVGMTGDSSFAASAVSIPQPVSVEAPICPGALVGAPVAVTNGGFETPHLSGNTYQTLAAGSAVLDGWSVAGSVDITFGTFWQNEEGTQSLDLNGTATGSVAQTITTVPGQAYQVSFWLAGNAYCAPTIKVAEVEAAGHRESFQFDVTGHSNAAMGWASSRFVFLATDTTTLLTFRSLVAGACGPTLDNVEVAALDCPTQ